jgi:tagatose 6-phosphate kinase
VMSGGLTPDGPADFYARAVQLANDSGVMNIVDATGEPLRRAVQARPTIVKINEREYRTTFEREAIEHRRLIADGLLCGVITRGPEPALAWNERQAWWIHPPRVKTVSPIGSGDAFTAALAAGLVRDDSMPDACCLAAACAVANAITPVSGFVELSDVQRLREQIRVEPA